MTKIILAVFSDKGGAGKSATVVKLARLLNGRRPWVADTDPQNATRHFKLPRCTVRPVSLAEGPDQLTAFLEEAGPTVIIDAPPTMDAAAIVLGVATHILVPIPVAPQAAIENMALVPTIEKLFPDVPVRVLATMYVQNSPTAREVLRDMRETFGERMFKTVIVRNDEVFNAAVMAGRTIIDNAPDSKPTKQYRELAEEIKVWLQN